jgi:hypothetical protein
VAVAEITRDVHHAGHAAAGGNDEGGSMMKADSGDASTRVPLTDADRQKAA